VAAASLRFKRQRKAERSHYLVGAEKGEKLALSCLRKVEMRESQLDQKETKSTENTSIRSRANLG